MRGAIVSGLKHPDAEAAGIKVEMRLTSINGQSLAGMNQEQIKGRLAGFHMFSSFFFVFQPFSAIARAFGDISEGFFSGQWLELRVCSVSRPGRVGLE